MKWFKHDSNAHSDNKIKRVLMRYGVEGYGLYFYCLELIAGNIEGADITFELEHDAEVIAYDLKMDTLKVEEILKFFVQLELFDICEGRLRCTKIASKLDERFTRSQHLKGIIQTARAAEKPTQLPSPASEDCLKTVGDMPRQSEDCLPTVDSSRSKSKSRSNSITSSSTYGMHENWQPDISSVDDFRNTIESMGARLEYGSEDIDTHLAEFIGYWSSRVDANDRATWTHKFKQSIVNRYNHWLAQGSKATA